MFAAITSAGASALGDKIEAGSCTIAKSGIASGNTFNCNFGLTPEQLKQVVRGATEALQDHIDKISETMGSTSGKNIKKYATVCTTTTGRRHGLAALCSSSSEGR